MRLQNSTKHCVFNVSCILGQNSLPTTTTVSEVRMKMICIISSVKHVLNTMQPASTDGHSEHKQRYIY